jgi:2-iminobutanoate/2-iminopropanoate deaminase
MLTDKLGDERTTSVHGPRPVDAVDDDRSHGEDGGLMTPRDGDRLTALRTPGSLSAKATVIAGTAYTTVIPLDQHGELPGPDIETQTRQAFANLADTLRLVGSDLGSMAHLTIYLTDIQRDRPTFNQVYAEVIGDQVPVRCAVGVAELARPGMLVELTAIAAVTHGASGVEETRGGTARALA